MPDIFLRPGEASPSDVRLRDTTLADSGASFTSTATWVQAAASWAASASEEFAATATWAQAAASWAASGAESFPSTASWAQAAATWAAAASEEFAATATFAQAAASWSATSAETFATTATFAQTASWSAATDTGSGSTFSATYGGYPLIPSPPKRRPIAITTRAAFRQPAASWQAVVDIREDEDWLLFGLDFAA